MPRFRRHVRKENTRSTSPPTSHGTHTNPWRPFGSTSEPPGAPHPHSQRGLLIPQSLIPRYTLPPLCYNRFSRDGIIPVFHRVPASRNYCPVPAFSMSEIRKRGQGSPSLSSPAFGSAAPFIMPVGASSLLVAFCVTRPAGHLLQEAF